ncbi:MAG: serine/threonine protein phosphatase [Thermoprotei archaeon]|nr:MAG: serine/threonine protein phosphatase [Thermoprotei archaeon]
MFDLSNVTAREFIELIEHATNLLRELRERGEKGKLVFCDYLVELPSTGTIVVMSDFHGDYDTLLNVFRVNDVTNKLRSREDFYLLFLGDYGDRGSRTPEVWYAVLRVFTQFPDKVILLRGNHEFPPDLLVYPYDSPLYFRRLFGSEGVEIVHRLEGLFNELFVACRAKNGVFFVHGGADSAAKSIEDISKAPLKHPQEPHLEELLWNDPRDDITGTVPSPRGAGKLFGPDVTTRFLELVNSRVLVRGHEPVLAGYHIAHGGKVLTIFTRRGPPYFNLHAAYLVMPLSRVFSNAYELRQYIYTLG